MSEDDSFLSRWSRRKALVRRGVEPPQPAARGPEPEAARPAAVAPPAQAPAAPLPAAPATAAATADEPAAQAPAVPPPTLDDAARLEPGADVRRFMAPGVDGPVRNAALKKLFADPHFNVMDGLDTYIDDYSRPDPLPAHLLRRMTGARLLGLFDDEGRADAAAGNADATPRAADLPPTDPAEAPRHEDPDLRLQPNDAAEPGAAGAHGPGAGEDPAGQR